MRAETAELQSQCVGAASNQQHFSFAEGRGEYSSAMPSHNTTNYDQDTYTWSEISFCIKKEKNDQEVRCER